MHIEKFTVCGRSYLRLVRSRRGLTKNGNPISGKELIFGLGPFARHDDGEPGYLERLRASFRAGRPLIRELDPFVGEARKGRILVPFEPGDAKCLGKPRRMAATILDPVFNALGLDGLFASVKSASRIRYDLTGIVRLLTCGRLLDPASKSATMEQNARYYRPPVSSTNDDNVYDALDVIQRSARQIVRRMNTRVARGAGRGSKVVFYDVTNFFFEIPRPDPDTVDADGNVVAKSLRRSMRQEIAWAVSPDGYDLSDEAFRCKSRIVERTVTLADGTRRKLREKVVVYWSKAFYERELRENASFLSFVERLKANPGGFRITAAQSRGLRRFLKKDVLDRKTGNVLDGTRLAAMIDDGKLSAFNELFGYYQMLNASDDDVTTLFKAFGIDIPAKIYTRGDIRDLKSAINSF